jgi:hypothetical protein
MKSAASEGRAASVAITPGETNWGVITSLDDVPVKVGKG